MVRGEFVCLFPLNVGSQKGLFAFISLAYLLRFLMYIQAYFDLLFCRFKLH